MRIINWPNAPEWRQDVQLEGVTYHLVARYNTVRERWTMDIYTKERSLLLGGVAILRGVLLLRQFTITGLPPGDMAVLGDEPDRDNMGVTSFLVYYTAAEVADAESQ